MAKSTLSRLVFKLNIGLLALWLSAGRVWAHSGEVAPHPHRDWLPLIIVGICLLALFGALGIWRYRRWLWQRRQPEAFVPPPIGLMVDDEDDD